MPFDSLALPETHLDPLIRLNVTPIPPETVVAYKKAYRAAELARTGLPSDGVRWATRRQGKCDLEEFLSLPLPCDRALFARDRSPVPPPLADLARTVHAALPAAQFSVDFLSLDPVLNVTYAFEGKRVKACLGIWESHQIKMIASVA